MRGTASLALLAVMTLVGCEDDHDTRCAKPAVVSKYPRPRTAPRCGR